MKTYKTIGLPYYATNCEDVTRAVLVFLANRIGVTANDLIEATEIEEGGKVFDWLANLQHYTPNY